MRPDNARVIVTVSLERVPDIAGPLCVVAEGRVLVGKDATSRSEIPESVVMVEKLGSVHPVADGATKMLTDVFLALSKFFAEHEHEDYGAFRALPFELEHVIGRPLIEKAGGRIVQR